MYIDLILLEISVFCAAIPNYLLFVEFLKIDINI